MFLWVFITHQNSSNSGFMTSLKHYSTKDTAQTFSSLGFALIIDYFIIIVIISRLICLACVHMFYITPYPLPISACAWGTAVLKASISKEVLIPLPARPSSCVFISVLATLTPVLTVGICSGCFHSPPQQPYLQIFWDTSSLSVSLLILGVKQGCRFLLGSNCYTQFAL